MISAAWVSPDILNLRVLFIDEECGELRISVRFKDNTITVGFKRAAEFLIRRYGGIISGKNAAITTVEPMMIKLL